MKGVAYPLRHLSPHPHTNYCYHDGYNPDLRGTVEVSPTLLARRQQGRPGSRG